MALSFVKNKYLLTDKTLNFHKKNININFLPTLDKICDYMSDLNFLPILDKICDYTTEFNFYSTFLNPIINLEPNDKIGIINIQSNNLFNFKLYLDKYNTYQSFNRWYNNQKRGDIFEKLDIVFTEYNKYIKSIDIIKMNELYNDIINFNTILITKLQILKNTYNDNNVSIKIDNYIILCSS